MIRKVILAGMALAATVSSLAAYAQDTIKIGGLFETSGFLAMLGNQGYEGANLAIDHINASGGLLGKKVEFININTESDETKAVISAKRLIEREKVVALVGAMNSGSTFAAIDTIQRAKIPTVSNGASRAIVTPPEQKRWIFLAPLTDALVIEVIIDHMKKNGISRIALVNSDSGFATSGRGQWEKLAPANGIKIVTQQTFGNNDADMTPQLTNVRGSDAQATVVWTTGKSLSIVALNYRQLGINLPIYYSHGASDPNLIKLAGGAANGIIFPTSKIGVASELPDSDPQKQVIKKFVSDFTAKYGREPATFAGNGFDSVMLLASAIRRAKSTDSEKVRDALENTKNHAGVTAIYTYSPTDHFGALPSSVMMHTIKDGKIQLLKQGRM
jgi:branched-chain amino acid transport system substrate-binding protein